MSYKDYVASPKFQATMAKVEAQREEECEEGAAQHAPEAHDKTEERRLVIASAVAVESQEAEAEAERREIGYCCRYLVQATMPHSKPSSDATEFRRKNGNVTLSIVARREFGLPYGRYPRQILAWMGRESVITRSPVIRVGGSLREFITGKLKRKYSSGRTGSASAIKEQLVRLVTSDIKAIVSSEGKLVTKSMTPIDESIVFWDSEDHSRIVDWKADLVLAPKFFEELIARPIPVCVETLCGFRGPLSMDVYTWLTHRMSYLRKPTTVPWEMLHEQYGCGYPKTPQGLRDFRKFYLRSLHEVVERYRAAKVYSTKPGLLLHPSPPHIPLRSLPGGKR